MKGVSRRLSAWERRSPANHVPTPNVSVVDLTFVPERAASVDSVNAAIRAAAETDLRGILSYEEDPMVSIDFNHDTHSSCFAAAQTSVTEGGLVRVVSWYDNEWGFSNRMVDTGCQMGELLHSSIPVKIAS